VHVTRDGGTTWADVTPPALRAWDKISQIDAGHFDADTAYVAVNAIRRNDMRPHVYRTHDGGASWEHVADGMNPSGPVNVVREDPQQPGLLFAGTEREVYFSADDGDSWQSLRLNMPATSVRDLVIHEDDLVVGTHGRSIWILDGIHPLRQNAVASETAARNEPFLFAPARATRVRWNMFSDTPLPPDEPAGENPPDGAILDYLLPQQATEVMLQVLDADGGLVASFDNEDAVEALDPTTMAYPTYWIRPPQTLGTAAGHHRFIWDLRYPAPPGARRSHSIAAVRERTPSGPRGPFVPPGTYTVRLWADGVMRDAELQVRMDPRAEISAAGIAQQTEYSIRAYTEYLALAAMRDGIDARFDDPDLDATHRVALQELRGSGAPGNPDATYGSIYETPVDEETIVGLQDKLLFVLEVLQSADAAPTAQARAAVEALEAAGMNLRERMAAVR
jgi:hypothetical protein